MQKRINSFLENKRSFDLGHLDTENFNPLTLDLSQKCQDDLLSALKTCRDVDIAALNKLLKVENSLFSQLQKAITNCSGKIFIVGCGSTGRLALLLESFGRRIYHKSTIHGVIAGGDIALINSVESFEDHPDYAVKQLEELEFNSNDLLIGVSEGGETPFVIGAVEYAKEFSKHIPLFLYCNSDDQLMSVERSKSLIMSDLVTTLSLPTGPQSLSGSTRMQASTILTLFLGAALFDYDFIKITVELKELLEEFDFEKLKLILEHEFKIYQSGKIVNYRVSKDSAMGILTDTTERAPTFNLAPFENFNDENRVNSLSYIYLPETDNNSQTWRNILGREPRGLDWKSAPRDISTDQIFGHVISSKLISLRDAEEIVVELKDSHLFFLSSESSFVVDLSSKNYLTQQLFLKMIINSYSLCLMGLMGRYSSNIMTWVRPTNNKLIDRATRFAMMLLEQRGLCANYEEIATEMIKISAETSFDKSIVEQIVSKRCLSFI